MRDSRGLVSVVVPAFNRAELLPRAVSSVLRQTYSNVEVLIMDDGSTDRTADVASELMLADDRVHYVLLEHGGAGRARNAGIRLAQGEFIAFQDTDDEWDEAFLAKMTAEAKGSENCIVFCSHRVVHIDGRVDTVPSRLLEHPDDRLVRGNVISTQTALVPSSVFAAGHSFDESLRRFQDWDLWLQVVGRRTAAFKHVPEVLATLYRQTDSLSEGSARVRRLSLQHITKKHLRLLGSRPIGLATILARTYLNLLRFRLQRLRSS